MKRLITVFIISLVVLTWSNPAGAEGEPVKEIQVIGEFFGHPVPAQNYFFIKSVLLTFGNVWGVNPQNDEELDSYIWDYLLLSYEAFQNNIVASPEEINAEIKRILKDNNAGFDWNKDKEAFTRWVEEKIKQLDSKQQKED